MDEKYLTAGLVLKDDAPGAVTAAFSIFGMVDSDGDVVEASAFTDGQAVAMVWSHDWKSHPVGRGVVRVTPREALFDGQFIMDTTAGMDAYKTVKAMAELQQWSWGFEVLDAEFGTLDGKQVRYIKRTKLFEVSPVLVGANQMTHTVAIKGQRLADHEALVRAQVPDVVERWRSLADAELKIGAAISRARRDRIGSLRDVLRSGADELDALLSETEPKANEDGKAGLHLYAAFLKEQARLLGVAV